MVMTKSGRTLDASHRDADVAPDATSRTREPERMSLDADEQQHGVATHEDPHDAEAHEQGGDNIGTGEVDHASPPLPTPSD